MTANVWQLGEVAEIEAQMFRFAQMFIRSTTDQCTSVPAICYSPC